MPVIVYLPPKPQPLGLRSVKSSFRLGEKRYEELRFEDADVVAQSAPQLASEVDDNLDSGVQSTGRSEQHHTPTTLALTAGAVVVQINYRALTYPQPVHDVLAGWDWVVKNVKVLQGRSSFEDRGLAEAGAGQSRGATSSMGIGVYGKLVGGSLGVMLGLTECDAGATATATNHGSNYSWATNKTRVPLDNKEKVYVKAVVTRDAIVDWVFPPPTDTTTSSASVSSNDSISSGLQHLRDSMFRAQSHPSTYFDPFASPIHFLRTPSAAQPPAVHTKEDTRNKATTKSESDEFELLARLEEETARALQPTLSSYSLASSRSSQPVGADATGNLAKTTSNLYDAESPATAAVISTVDIDTTQRRKVPLRWPPSSLPHTMRMPDFLLTVDHTAEIGISPSTTAAATTEPTSTRKTVRRPTTTTLSNSLLQQNEEMTRLLRRSWVKYCMLYESDQESLTNLTPASNATDIHVGITKGSAKLDLRGMKGLIISGDRLLDRLILKGLMDEKAGDEAEANDGGYRSDRSGYADDGEEEELQAQLKEVQVRVKAKVQYEVVEEQEMQLKRVGQWLSASLRR